MHSVLITACGNFRLVGLGNPEIVTWNMQSSIQRELCSLWVWVLDMVCFIYLFSALLDILHNSQWLVTRSLDSKIHTFNIPTSTPIACRASGILSDNNPLDPRSAQRGWEDPKWQWHNQGGHTGVTGNKEADQLAKSSLLQCPLNPNYKTQGYIGESPPLQSKGNLVLLKPFLHSLNSLIHLALP